MELTLLIKLMIGLISILAILIFLLLYSKKGGSKNSDSVLEVEFKELIAVVKNNDTNSKELKYALDQIIKNYGFIQSDKFGIYEDILHALCNHPNTNKDIILDFDSELARLNPKYKKQIGKAVVGGLNLREE